MASTQREAKDGLSDGQVVVVTALCWSLVYLVAAFSDARQFNEILGPVNARIGDVASYALTLVPPMVTCGVILAYRGRAHEPVLNYAITAGALTAAGVIVGFFFVLFGGGTQ